MSAGKIIRFPGAGSAPEDFKGSSSEQNVSDFLGMHSLIDHGLTQDEALIAIDAQKNITQLLRQHRTQQRSRRPSHETIAKAQKAG